MKWKQSLLVGVMLLAANVAGSAVAFGQGVEITPFAGYRFGGDFFELVTRHPVDLDGAPAFGVVLNVPLSNGFQIEGLFSHERALVPAAPFPLAPLWQLTVDHWQVGGLQEFPGSRVRPFMTGTMGLTRYAGENDSEIRFALAAGGGVKLFPNPHVGLRLESRVFATFVDAGGTAIACSPGVCLLALHVNVVWQVEFTAGLIFRFQ